MGGREGTHHSSRINKTGEELLTKKRPDAVEAEAGRRPGEGRPIFPHEWLLLLRCAAHPPERAEASRPTRQEGRYQARPLQFHPANTTPAVQNKKNALYLH